MINTAVIIAGGAGTRLKPLTDEVPKPLVKVGEKPILQWNLEWLKAHGIKNVVIGVAYKKEAIYEFMNKNNNFGLNVKFSEHTVDGGTAQAFKLAISRHVPEDIHDFVAMNGDELTNLDMGEMAREHISRRKYVTMATAPFYCAFSTVQTDKENNIHSFIYGRRIRQIPISIGIYIFNRKILDKIPETGSIENSVFVPLADSKEMIAYPLLSGEEWVSVNAHKDISEAEKSLREWGRL